ncbi:MAG: tripartite tricarboxylate transporter substrate binding protein, partial [Planctomycetes bacterium]|nr:tripartite tricarboxylate transporter substrate binding protein [Planctomycetota bacterium]
MVWLVWTGCESSDNSKWPTKPISIYVGWSAGGTSDITTRAVALEMEKQLGQKILVINVTGAMGSISAAQVAAAPPDGYLWFGGSAVHGTWPVLGYGQVSWTNYYAFLSVVFPTTIYVRHDAPWQTIEQLITDIKSHPKDRHKFSHPGVGSNGDIFAGLLLDAAGVGGKAISIPYNGGREAGRYLLAGEVDFASVSMGDLSDWATAGRLRPLANLHHEDVEFSGVTFPAITRVYPELEPYQAINPYFGVYLHRSTPEPIVTQVAEAFVHAIQQERFKKLVVEERSGIWSPLLGRASDEQMSRIESARGWALYELGVAPRDPAEFGIPKLSDW